VGRFDGREKGMFHFTALTLSAQPHKKSDLKTAEQALFVERFN
jgi:hypothetical protein